MTAEVEERSEAPAAARAPHEDEPIRRAKQRAEAIQGLYIHLLVYLVINAGLFVINLLTKGDGGTWWFYWPVAIWGIALLIHVVTIFVPVFSPEWAERRAARMLEEDRRF
ncbi:MAG TPA: 2TM domain-containing protein [Actinomycetota bacterium]